MHLRVQTLRESDQVKQIFAADGWRVEQAHPDTLRVRHPEVTDRMAARVRLDRLGLLTSTCCQIDFPPGP